MRDTHAFIKVFHNRRIVFYCPACENLHTVAINSPDLFGEMWLWDGDYTQPTIEPISAIKQHCKFVIRNGYIHYSGENNHPYRNSIIKMQNIQ